MNVKINRIYKHFKGDLYLVQDIGIDSDTMEECVIYRALYGDNKLYIRRLKEFTSDVDKIKYPNCKQQKRFELASIESVRK